ncbi:uncharacterized protein LOC121053558 [Oryza brachyantha]|uniref:uncharacterized protein LOC121053558 n=1 Tax=Oryza brachyantha TaxID=4533 RepID=UPI001ADAB798|nr:uncharacterized protein LOC121053558 [Oryza brachyantha]
MSLFVVEQRISLSIDCTPLHLDAYIYTHRWMHRSILGKWPIEIEIEIEIEMERYYSTRAGGDVAGGGNKTAWVCATPGPMLLASFAVSPDLRTTEKFMVTTTVLMTFLGAALFAVGILGRFSGRHRGHSAATRIFFRVSFALFLPFMSFMFSQAKGKDVPFRAYLILLWMLLVELLRKKVYAMVAPAGDTFSRGVGRYSLFDAVEDATRMVWIGYLIYSYVHGFAVKALFVILWIFGVVKLCKRSISIHLANRSLDLAKNAALVSGYMAQLVGAHRQLELERPLLLADINGADVRGNSTMRACNYTVMGESQLKTRKTPHGIEVDGLHDILAGGGTEQLVRVSTIWKLAETDPLFKYDVHRKQKLEDICLGLALFKLLRRRIERCHMAESNTPEARAFVLKGLLALAGGQEDDAANAKRAFDVVEMELRFMEEYYQAIITLALPKPTIFIANFVFSIVFILLYCVAVLLVTGNGNIFRVLGSLFRGLIGLSIDMVVQYRCFRHQVSVLVGMVCSSSDLVVTFLLTLTLFSVETYELAQYLLSDWFAASMLCNYARKPALQKQVRVQRTVRCGLWVRHRSRPVIKVQQVTMLKLHHLHPRRLWILLSRILAHRLAGLSPAVVTTEAKVAIVAALKEALESGGGDAGDLHFSSCVAVLRKNGFAAPEWACDSSGGAATVILVWHLATALLETGGKPRPPKGDAAVTLSRYCAYLVSYEPGLLPDDPEWTEKAYRDMRRDLGGFFQSCCTAMDRRRKLLQLCDDWHDDEASAMARGVRLGKQLEQHASRSDGDFEKVWTMLLDFWGRLLVVVAPRPSAGPEGHALALAQGGEFITHVWAMMTHAGVRVHRHHDYQSIPVTDVV